MYLLIHLLHMLLLVRLLLLLLLLLELLLSTLSGVGEAISEALLVMFQILVSPVGVLASDLDSHALSNAHHDGLVAGLSY